MIQGRAPRESISSSVHMRSSQVVRITTLDQGTAFNVSEGKVVVKDIVHWVLHEQQRLVNSGQIVASHSCMYGSYLVILYQYEDAGWTTLSL
jgi:hypothetical protein